MPEEGSWIEVGDGLKLCKSVSTEEAGKETSVRCETVTLTIKTQGSKGKARIDAFVDRAYAWCVTAARPPPGRRPPVRTVRRL